MFQGSNGSELTDSLSETEERRDLPLLCRLNWLLMSEVWLVTVERRVDMKLLLVERRSRWRTQSRTPRHGMYLANANLDRDTETESLAGLKHEAVDFRWGWGLGPSNKRAPNRAQSETRSSGFYSSSFTPSTSVTLMGWNINVLSVLRSSLMFSYGSKIVASNEHNPWTFTGETSQLHSRSRSMGQWRVFRQKRRQPELIITGFNVTL